MSVFVPRLPTDPVVATKHRVNSDDLVNPVLPHCDSRYWIVDSNAVREMTQAEKDSRWPPEVIKPKRWCKEQILLLEATPPYYVSRYDEEVYNALYDDQKAGFYVRCKKVINLKIDLRAIVTTDPAAWNAGQQEALVVRINEVLGWAN